MKAVSHELLAEMTRRLVAEFQPEQIILFGSHAWGTPNEDSDVDLLGLCHRATRNRSSVPCGLKTAWIGY